MRYRRMLRESYLGYKIPIALNNHIDLVKYLNYSAINQTSHMTSLQQNTPLSEILLFQENFLHLVHTEIYAGQQQLYPELILKFHINHMSEINEKYNKMVKELTQLLVQKQIPYDFALRDSFRKALTLDFLPLLRLNRYEITKLSLYGFDIYIEPLEALLQILSRIDYVKRQIVESQVQLAKSQIADSALEKGWQAYILFAHYWHLSFNLYILKEYLRVGGKSFLKKDRQIIFTGCMNLFNDLVPSLIQKNGFNALLQLGELNNSLYNFHPSYNYFHFYSLFFPLKQEYEAIFHSIYQITQKCIRTNIVTPLLFGLMRSKQSFLRFIEDVDSQIWLPYLNTLIAGIIITLKFRILQYEEILEVLQAAVNKAGLLGEVRTEQIIDELPKEWKQAKDFFISAIKIGYNPGQIQTWKTIEFSSIQGRVLKSILDGLLLNFSTDSTKLDLFLRNPEQKLQQEIGSLTEGKVTLSKLKTNIYSSQKDIITLKDFNHLIRIINLVQILKIQNQLVVLFLLDCIKKLNIVETSLIQRKVSEITEVLSKFVLQLPEIKLGPFRDLLVEFYDKYHPQSEKQKIISLYLDNFEPKKSIPQLLGILELSQQDKDLQKFVCLIIQRYVSIPRKKAFKMKTFQKEYIIDTDYININYQTHNLLAALTSLIIKEQPFSNEILKLLVLSCPWVSLSLLNFPINSKQELISFSSWLINEPRLHHLLIFILQKSIGIIITDKSEDLMLEIIFPSISDQIIKKINEKANPQAVYAFAKLLLSIYSRSGRDSLITQNYRELLSIYIYLLEKSEKLQLVKEIVEDLPKLIIYALGSKIEVWFSYMEIVKIEGETQFSLMGARKKNLKHLKDSIYFICEADKQQQDLENKKEYYSQNDILQRFNQKKDQNRSQTNDFFFQQFQKSQKRGIQQHKRLLQRQNIIFLEQLRQLFIPQVSKQFLKLIIDESNKSNDESAIPAIRILSLNSFNNIFFLEQAIADKNIPFLQNARLIYKMCSKLPALLSLEKQQDAIILSKMGKNLSKDEKIKIAEHFDLQNQIIPIYLQRIDSNEYLVIFNSTNWRNLMQYFTKQLFKSNLPSILLQYGEYVRITNTSNKDYDEQIQKTSNFFLKYMKLAYEKLTNIFSSSLNEQQLNLRIANQVSSINVISSVFSLKDVLFKLSQFHKSMKERDLVYSSSLVDGLDHLNFNIHQLFNGHILIPDFQFGYYLTSQLKSPDYNIELGLYLQSYYQLLFDNLYIPKVIFQPKNLKKMNFEDFKIEKEDLAKEKIVINETNLNYQIIKNHYFFITEYLKNQQIVASQDSDLKIHIQGVELKQEDLPQIYKFGCLHAFLQENDKLKLDPILESCLKRRRLSWEILKGINSEDYHHIKSILVEQEIIKKNIFFNYSENDLIPKGSKFQVNELNKEDYCNKVALRALGPSYLRVLQNFTRGYIYQKHSL